jgi:hypothetical protein
LPLTFNVPPIVVLESTEGPVTVNDELREVAFVTESAPERIVLSGIPANPNTEPLKGVVRTVQVVPSGDVAILFTDD